MSSTDQARNDPGPEPTADPSAPPSSVDGRRASRRVLIVWSLAAGCLVVALVILLRVLVVRPIPDLTAERLMTAMDLWRRQGPANYDMDIEISGLRAGEVHVEVRQGNVVALVRDGKIPPERTWDVWSVRGQFEMLNRELDIAEDPIHEMNAEEGTRVRLRCEFDPQYGFPRRFQRFVYGSGPNVAWRVTSFTVQ